MMFLWSSRGMWLCAIGRGPWSVVSGGVFRCVCSRHYHRRHKVRLVTSRGFISSDILQTVNSYLAGGCTRNCPRGHCCNNYRIISGIRRYTVSHIYGLFKTRCTGIRPRSNTRTGTTILLTILGPNSAFLNLGLSRNNRLSRNSPIGASKLVCRTIKCDLGRRANQISCSTVRTLTRRRRPGLVVNNKSTCSHR